MACDRKTVFCYLIFLIVSVVLAAPPCFAENPADGRTYKLVVNLTQSSGMDSQARSIANTYTEALRNKTAINMDVVFMNDEKEIIREVESNNVDFVMSYNLDLPLKLLFEYDFDTRITFEVFGHPPTACIYTKKYNPASSIEDLEGMKLMTYGILGEYYRLRFLVGRPPEDFFDPLLPFPEALSGIFALAFDKSDAIYADTRNIDLLEKTNPGPVKDIKVIACQEDYLNPFFFHSKDVPPDVLKEVIDFTVNVHNIEDFKNYRPLMKMMDFEWKKVSKKDFEQFYLDLKKADEEGWNEDFEMWIRYTSDKED